MFLDRLEIQGFKSFAQRVIFDFTMEDKTKPRMTAIVGPNGSGKSNVADAIRWVLGEQSMKTLRGKRGEDVIFSGSDKRARLGFAEVSMFLDNHDQAMPIEYKEVVITRRLYRDGESEYLINKSKARLQDILLLLARANFGQKSYSVIGQGMVDSILRATPLERKDYFDEAAGVKVYQIKREQSLNKLEASQENLNQADMLLQEITPRLRSLTRQVNRLEKREVLEKELRDLQSRYYSHLWQDINNRYQERLADFKDADQKRQAKVQALTAVQQEFNSLEKDETSSDVFGKLQKEFEKLLEEKNKFREKELVLENKIEFAKRTQTRVAVGVIPLAEVVSELEVISGLENKLLAKVRSAKTLDDLEQIKGEFVSLEQITNTLIKKIKFPSAEPQAKEANPVLTKELIAVREGVARFSKELALSQQKIRDFQEEEKKKKGDFFELQRKLQNRQIELNELVAQTNNIRIELARLETRKEDLEKEICEELKITSQEIGRALKMKGVEGADLPAQAGEGIKGQDGVMSYEMMPEEIFRLKHQLELIGGIDPETVAEYKEAKERYDFLTVQTEDLKTATISLRQIIDELDETIKKQFDEAFKNINEHFERYFRLLFQGGKARLVLQKGEEGMRGQKRAEEGVEAEEAAAGGETTGKGHEGSEKAKDIIQGVEIEATPPGKRLKDINILSGGERALTSIALICAIISNNPSPFVVLDEVDAALDESNSIKFAQILSDLYSKTQFIVITHNRATMEKANMLYGVTMGDDGVSRLLSIKLEDVSEDMMASRA